MNSSPLSGGYQSSNFGENGDSSTALLVVTLSACRGSIQLPLATEPSLLIAQVLISKGNTLGLRSDILFSIRRASLLADPAAVLAGAVLPHHEAADPAHDQASLRAILSRQAGTS